MVKRTRRVPGNNPGAPSMTKISWIATTARLAEAPIRRKTHNAGAARSA